MELAPHAKRNKIKISNQVLDYTVENESFKICFLQNNNVLLDIVFVRYTNSLMRASLKSTGIKHACTDTLAVGVYC